MELSPKRGGGSAPRWSMLLAGSSPDRTRKSSVDSAAAADGAMEEEETAAAVSLTRSQSDFLKAAEDDRVSVAVCGRGGSLAVSALLMRRMHAPAGSKDRKRVFVVVPSAAHVAAAASSMGTVACACVVVLGDLLQWLGVTADQIVAVQAQLDPQPTALLRSTARGATRRLRRALLRHLDVDSETLSSGGTTVVSAPATTSAAAALAAAAAGTSASVTSTRSAGASSKAPRRKRRAAGVSHSVTFSRRKASPASLAANMTACFAMVRPSDLLLVLAFATQMDTRLVALLEAVLRAAAADSVWGDGSLQGELCDAASPSGGSAAAPSGARALPFGGAQVVVSAGDDRGVRDGNIAREDDAVSLSAAAASAALDADVSRASQGSVPTALGLLPRSQSAGMLGEDAAARDGFGDGGAAAVAGGGGAAQPMPLWGSLLMPSCVDMIMEIDDGPSAGLAADAAVAKSVADRIMPIVMPDGQTVLCDARQAASMPIGDVVSRVALHGPLRSDASAASSFVLSMQVRDSAAKRGRSDRGPGSAGATDGANTKKRTVTMPMLTDVIVRQSVLPRTGERVATLAFHSSSSSDRDVVRTSPSAGSARRTHPIVRAASAAARQRMVDSLRAHCATSLAPFSPALVTADVRDATGVVRLRRGTPVVVLSASAGSLSRADLMGAASRTLLRRCAGFQPVEADGDDARLPSVTVTTDMRNATTIRLHVWASVVTPVVHEGVFAAALWQQGTLSREAVARSGTLPMGHAACVFGVGVPIITCDPSPSWSVVSAANAVWDAGLELELDLPTSTATTHDNAPSSFPVSAHVRASWPAWTRGGASLRVKQHATIEAARVGVINRAELFRHVGGDVGGGMSLLRADSVSSITRAMATAALNVGGVGGGGECGDDDNGDDDWHKQLMLVEDDRRSHGGSDGGAAQWRVGRNPHQHGRGHATERLAKRRAERRKLMTHELKDHAPAQLLT